MESEENTFGGRESPDLDSSKKADPQPTEPPRGHIPAALQMWSPGSLTPAYAVIVDKTLRTLSVWKWAESGPELVEFHPMDLGRNAGDKEVLGDRKTPEGIYFVQDSYEGKQLNFEEYGQMAFTLDYPNHFDRLNKKTGSGIWLHAVPDKVSLWRGSRGCVVVRNSVIKILRQYLQLKRTPVIIADKVQYKSRSEFVNTTVQTKTWLEKWRLAWESKALETYPEFYDSSFFSQGMDLAKWVDFKRNLASRYDFIRVKIDGAFRITLNDTTIIKFLQSYESNKNSDVGEKLLYIKSSGDKMLILAEHWFQVEGQAIASKNFR